jgi:hypothetical protein
MTLLHNDSAKTVPTGGRLMRGLGTYNPANITLDFPSFGGGETLLTAVTYNFQNVLYSCLRTSYKFFSAGFSEAVMTLSLPPGYLNLGIRPATERRPLLAKLRPDDPST